MKKDSRGSLSPLLHLTYVLQQLSDKNLQPAVGVGLGQVRIMSVLSGSSVSSQNYIAHALSQTEANVSRQLRPMKRRNLVSVTRSKKDARLREVRLTAKGAKTYKLAVKVLASQGKELLRLLDTKDQKAFDKSLSNLLSALNISVRKRLL